MTKSSKAIGNKKCDFTKLMQWTPESFYWLGFLLADGHFGKNSIKLTLSCQDREHLSKFAKLINVKIYEDKPHMSEYGLVRSVTASGFDSSVVPFIKNKFGIHSQKTFTPPNIRDFGLDDISLLSLIIGLIDGDGTISKTRNRIAIEADISWKDNFEYIYQFIYQYTRNLFNSSTFVSSRGNSYLSIGKSEIVSNLKFFIEQYNLPVLGRKWSHITPIPFRRDVIIPSKFASKCKPITIDGIVFGSISEASRYFDCNTTTISRRILPCPT